MSWWEILLIVAAAAFVAGVAIFSFVRRKQGKGDCGCGCAHCSGCCPQAEKERDKTGSHMQSP